MDIIAKLALIAWVPISVLVAGSLRPTVACAGLLIAGVLLLPTKLAFDFPLIPPIGRQEITTLSFLLVVLLYFPARLWRARPGWGVDALIFVLILGNVGTALTNADSLVYGPTVLRAAQPYDALSDSVRDVVRFLLPFLLGRAFFRNSRDLRTLLVMFVGAALLYSLPILFELRMSPQLHRWIYGFFPHSFHQHVRWGGYRPMVFMPNGLALASFIACATVAAAALGRAKLPVFQIAPQPVTAYLGGLLVMCKSYASMSYAFVGVPVIAYLSPRNQTRIAALLAVLVMIYPMARSLDFFPREGIVNAAAVVSIDRADSLEYRFRNEDILLAKANERVLFGWGGYNRSRVYSEKGGGDLTITDGYWIIQLGSRGIVGLLGSFGFTVVPVLLAYRRIRLIPNAVDRQLVAGLALVVALMTVDLLPNGLFTHLPLFLGGALNGCLQGMPVPAARLRAMRRNPQRGGAARAPSPRPKPREPLAANPVSSAPSASLAAARRLDRGRS